jgi:predicted GNAT family N-acyltransferase
MSIMVKKIIIRKVEIGDIKVLVTLDKEAGKEISWWRPLGKKDFIKLLKNIYVAEENNKIIGYISGKIDNKNFILEDMYVKKGFRNQKIATRLVKKLLQNIKFKPKNIQLKCPERLRKFYEKFGFKVSYVGMKK